MKRTTIILLLFFGLTTNALAQDLQDGLMAHWQFDGNLSDATGNGNNGQANGSVTYTSDRDGNANSAVTGFTSSNYPSVPNATGVQPGTTYSIGGYFKLNDYLGTQTLWSKGEGLDYAMRFSHNTMSSVIYLNESGLKEASFSTASLASGTWYHIMTTWDGATLKVFLNGTQVASTAAVGTNPSWPMPLGFGVEIAEFGAPNNPMNGALDDIRFYNRAITGTEVQMLAGINVNLAPTAAFTATPGTGADPLTVQFDANTSTDPNGDVLTYTWDFGDGTVGSGITSSNTFNEGLYTISLTVADPDGLSDTTTSQVTVTANQPPTASFTSSVTSGFPPLTVNFDASGSSDTPGDQLSYAWNFGDGNSDTGVTVSHVYQGPGDFTVTLTVTDLAGSSDTAASVITSFNSSPTARFTATPTSGMAPLTVDFDGSTSSDPDSDPLTFAWDFGDGSSGTGETASHEYATDGTFTVTLQVDDGRGGTGSETGSITVAPFNQAPTASFTATPDAGRPPLTVSFDGSGSSDPDGDTLTYLWDLGDGSSSTEASFEHVYNTTGTLTVILTVTDPLGLSGATTSTITLELPAGTVIATSEGGPWSSTSTWVGNVLPTAQDDVIIPSTVTGSGDCASLTIEPTGIWTPRPSAELVCSVTNNGSVGPTVSPSVDGTVINNGLWESPVTVSGDFENHGELAISGGVTVAGDFENDGELAISGDVIVAGDLHNETNWSSGRIVLRGADTQTLSHLSGFPFEAPIRVETTSSGKSTTAGRVQAGSDLEITSSLALGSETLDMAGFLLAFSNAASPSNGAIDVGSGLIFSPTGYIGSNVTYNGDFNLDQALLVGAGVVFNGTITNDGTLDYSPGYSGTELNVVGSFVNNGEVNLGTDLRGITVDGQIINNGLWNVRYTFCTGSVTDNGEWGQEQAGELGPSYLNMIGSDGRTILFRRGYVQAYSGSDAKLVGLNRVPRLDFGGTANVTVQPGAELTATQGRVSQYLVNHGTVSTTLRIDQSGTSNGGEYRAEIYRKQGSVIDSVVVAHIGAAPETFANAMSVQWDIQSFSSSAEDSLLGRVTFTYRPEDLNGNAEEGLVLIRTLDNGATWDAVSTPASTTLEQNGRITFTAIPANGRFGMTSTIEAVNVRRSVAFSVLSGGVNARGPRGNPGSIEVRYTNDSPVPIQDVLIRFQASNGLHIHSIWPSNPNGTYVMPGREHIIPIDSLTYNGEDGDVLLAVRDMAPGETRRFMVRTWAQIIGGKKPAVAGVLIVGGVIVGTAYTREWFEELMSNMWNTSYNNCDNVMEEMFYIFKDAFATTNSKWLGGEVPYRELTEKAVKKIIEYAIEHGIDVPGDDVANLGAQMLGSIVTNLQKAKDGLDYEAWCDWSDDYEDFADYMEYEWFIPLLVSADPNDKIGPTGFGDMGYMSSVGRMDYKIRFENKAEATAEAYWIGIDDTLHDAIDLSTVQFDGASSDLFTMTQNGNVLSFVAEGINLPPNETPPEGEGFVTFSAKLKEGLPSGTTITNGASIVFDVNKPILTNIVVNTLDFDAPVTTMNPLDATIYGDSVLVSWVSDDGGLAGTESVAVFGSRDGGPYEFMGSSTFDRLKVGVEPDAEYSFYALARDGAGNKENIRPAPVTTHVYSIGIEGQPDNVPFEFNLEQNFPNPFNPVTNIGFTLPATSPTTLTIYDVLGRRVEVLVDRVFLRGKHSVRWDSSKFASGLYLYQLVQDGHRQTRKLILLK